MWCTRWFLPLLLLPLPTATPYFLILFLVSLTLHARPCFYCIILLTALFTSSCYWQPVPTDVILRSIFPNASNYETLLDALNATTYSNGSGQFGTDTTALPKLTLINDRCWCDLSTTGLFEPFNTTQWRLNSFARTIGIPDAPRKHSQDVHRTEPTGTNLQPPNGTALDSNKSSIAGTLLNNIRTLPPREMFVKWLLHPLTAFGSSSLSPDISITVDPAQVSEEHDKMTETKMLSKTSGSTSGTVPRLMWSTYDLRPYGINLVVDFHWPRNSLSAAMISDPKL